MWNSAAEFGVFARVKVALLAAGVLLAMLGHAAHAQALSQPKIDIRQFGWQADGSLSSGSWNPVAVRVAGHQDSGPVRVQVVLKVSIGTGGRSLLYPLGAYGQEVALPPRVEKDLRIWVYVPGDGAYVGTVQLLTPSGQVLAEQDAQAQAGRGDIPLVGTLADSTTLAALLGRIEIPYQQGLTAQLRTIEIAAVDVPPRADYLQAFKAIALQGSAPSTLTSEQRRALQDWVIQGGHLLVVGGPDASRAAAVLESSSAPSLRFAGVDGQADLTGLADWIAPGQPLGTGSAARIEAATGERLAGRDRPLAHRAPWGQGTVTLLAADPTLDPLRGWSITPMLLRRVLEPALAPDRANNFDPTRQPISAANDDIRLVSALDALPPQVFPDWQQVGLLLAAFAALAGPVLHLLLWRADRRPLLWIAVPVLSLAFTGAIYLISGAVPGRDVIANAVSEIRLDPRSGEARQAVAVGFFAPLRDRLTVRSSGELPVRVWMGSTSGITQGLSPAVTPPLSATFGTPINEAATEPPYRVVTGRDTQVEFLPNAASPNGLRSVVFSRALPSLGRIETDLHIEGPEGLIRGTVRNSTPYLLDQVGIGIGLTLQKLGPLAPGQSVPVTVDPRTPAPSAPANVAYSMAWQMFGVPSPTLKVGSGGPVLELPSDPDLRRRMRLLETVLARGDRSRAAAYPPGSQPYQQSAPTPPMLVAMSSALIGEDALPSAGTQRTFELTVLDQPIELPIAPGPFKVLPVLLPPTVVIEAGATLSNNSYQGYSGGPTWIDLRGGAANYVFRAELPNGVRVDALTVKTTQSSAQIVTPGSGTYTGIAVGSRADSPVPSTTGTFRAFNWQTNAWEPLTPGATETTISNTAAFISQSGVVRIQVTSGGRDRSVRFQAPELTIVGEAPLS